MIYSLAPLLLAASVLPARAATGIPDFQNCIATSSPGCILITPQGDGPTLASRGLTISVVLLDSDLLPIADYPAVDIWFQGDGTNDLVMCYQGSIADQNTNAEGETTFTGAFAGGGWTQSGTRVYVAGMPIGAAPLPIDVASTDYNGDLSVDIADLGNFAADYTNGVYDFRADFTCDGVENLADIAAFASRNGTRCP
jgi:hypothetical protein